HTLSFFGHLAPVFRVEITFRCVVPIGEVDGLAAPIKDVVKNFIPASRTAARTDDPALDGSKLDGGILRQTDQVMGDHGLVASVHGDAPTSVSRHIVRASSLTFCRFPDDVLVKHIRVM